MQDNIRIYFTEKVKFEQIIKKNHDFNCRIKYAIALIFYFLFSF